MNTIENDLQKEYAMRFSAMAEHRIAVWKVLIRDFFQSRIGSNKDVLDLGSGWGEFINSVEAKTRYAMDLNPEAKERVENGVVFLQQDCSQRWELPDNSLDVVFTSNFFEHLPDKQGLLSTLREAHRCLRPGGRIICMGPNIRFVKERYWDFFDHYLPLSDYSLSEGLQMANFRIESAIPQFLPYTMSNSHPRPMLAIRLYLKMPLAWKVLGQQFLVTGLKA